MSTFAIQLYHFHSIASSLLPCHHFSLFLNDFSTTTFYYILRCLQFSSKILTYPLNYTISRKNWILHHVFIELTWSTGIFQKLFYNFCILWNLKVHYRIHNSPLFVLILKQLNPVQALSSCFRKLHFNACLISTFELDKVYSSFGQ
jgi:hypothetical protein